MANYEEMLNDTLSYYGMPAERISNCIDYIMQSYGACRYLDGVADGAAAVTDLGIDNISAKCVTKTLHR